ncbi:MAG: hypothetical protein LQ348_000653 [Seirophora lacunosa]|nr:MAG: hypothetical protein LQ348_000653 [Seirophora lacunosa]
MPAKARPKSMLSFTHRKSSSSSHPKVEELTETTQEKASHRVTSKADPTKAINELQPSATEIADTVGKLVCYRTVIAKRTSRETQELDQAEVQQSMRFIQL